MASCMCKKKLMFICCLLLVILVYLVYFKLQMVLKYRTSKHPNSSPDFGGEHVISLDSENEDSTKIKILEEMRKNLRAKTSKLPSSDGKNTSKPGLVPPKIKPPPVQKQNEVEPKEVDFIGDEYTIDEVPPKTNCSSSIQMKVQQTDFADRFMWTIPVLQWKKHFSQDEYQRLHHYPGAHGWGNVPSDVLQNTLNILNTSANQLMFEDWEKKKKKKKGHECIRCAVIGNGGILNGSRKGQEIDQHHYVFRTNGGITKGFEKDVGNRTSHYIFSFNTLKNSISSYKDDGFTGAPRDEETRYIFLPDHDKDYKILRAEVLHDEIDTDKQLPRYFGDNMTVEKFKMFHPDFIRYLRNRFLPSNLLKSKYKDIYRPTTGAVMLLAALHTCDEVNAYGFITPDYINYSDHYYDKKHMKLHFYANHDMKMEMSLWQDLHKSGLMKLYMRDGRSVL